MFKYPLVILSLFLAFWTLSIAGCATSKGSDITVSSVKYFGAKGDGVHDDTPAIQNALDRAGRVIFPRGDYRIASVSFLGFHNPHALLISEKSAVREIIFEPGARLFLDGKFSHSYKTFVVLKVLANTGSLATLLVKNLNVYQVPNSTEVNVTALKAIEHKGHQIGHLIIEGADIQNVTGGGLITYASKNTFTNIRTENCGSHGIGARNPYNPDEMHELNIDGYESINDQEYSIDFSGTQIGNDPSTADPRYPWKGVVRNVRSVDSKRGIKTAGYWNLKMENIEIIRPKIYGFFINKDAPGYTIEIDGLTITESGREAMSLSGRTNMNLRNVRLIGCGRGINVKGANLRIDGLVLDGKGRTEQVCRLANNSSLTNFSISNSKDEYIVWINRGNVTLTNGKIFDNVCKKPILVHENAGEVVLDNLTFDAANARNSPPVISIQKKENLTLRRMPQSSVRKQ